LGFFCAADCPLRTRQQAEATTVNAFTMLLRVRFAVTGAGAWAGIMDWGPATALGPLAQRLELGL
jgi:hypothetical protein